MGYRFFAIPTYRLTEAAAGPVPLAEQWVPDLPSDPGEMEQALGEAVFRDQRARDRLRALLLQGRPPYAPPGPGLGRAAVFAQPPNDLPALLRLADELDVLARGQVGERALVWACECGKRYAVPVTLARQVSIKCERCGKPVELIPSRALGAEQLLDAHQAAVNSRRVKLAEFFREAMARGWPVLVCTTDAK